MAYRSSGRADSAKITRRIIIAVVAIGVIITAISALSSSRAAIDNSQSSITSSSTSSTVVAQVTTTLPPIINSGCVMSTVSEGIKDYKSILGDVDGDFEEDTIETGRLTDSADGTQHWFLRIKTASGKTIQREIADGFASGGVGIVGSVPVQIHGLALNTPLEKAYKPLVVILAGRTSNVDTLKFMRVDECDIKDVAFSGGLTRDVYIGKSQNTVYGMGCREGGNAGLIFEQIVSTLNVDGTVSVKRTEARFNGERFIAGISDNSVVQPENVVAAMDELQHMRCLGLPDL